VNGLARAAVAPAHEAGRALPSMSARRLLRDALPPIYREAPSSPGGTPPLIERWLQACEEVLDPVLALLDNLAAHIDPRLAPADLLDLLGRWLGLAWPGDLHDDARRRLLDHATRIAKLRGTQAGLELVLSLAFPDLDLTVGHTGAITTTTDPAAVVPAREPRFDVRCAAPLDATTRAAVHAVIDDHRPVHVPYRLVDGPQAPP
jgi:phage tail-like protein